MKYLCLAYGDEKDWNELPKEQQEVLLAQDEMIRKRGALMASVAKTVTTVRNWDGTPATTEERVRRVQCPFSRILHHRGG